MKFTIFTLLLSSLPAFGAEKLLRSVYLTDPVEADPKVASFELRVQYKELLYSFSEGNPYYVSKMVAKVKTEESESLKEYGVVQFIRGCIFNSRQGVDGQIEYSIQTSRQFFDAHIPFKHPEWVLDSVDRDPVYWSGDEKTGRTGLYRLDDPMEHRAPELRRFLSKHFTNQDHFFVRDMPTGASEFYGEHQNVSLEFRTCLYRLDEVPAVTGPEGEELKGRELKCLEWESHYVYDYQKKNFQMRDSIHPFCLTP